MVNKKAGDDLLTAAFAAAREFERGGGGARVGQAAIESKIREIVYHAEATEKRVHELEQQIVGLKNQLDESRKVTADSFKEVQHLTNVILRFPEKRVAYQVPGWRLGNLGGQFGAWAKLHHIASNKEFWVPLQLQYLFLGYQEMWDEYFGDEARDPYTP